MEIRSTKSYWHMRNATTTYDPDFAANKMVGVVGGLDATCHTWFGEKFEFVVRLLFAGVVGVVSVSVRMDACRVCVWLQRWAPQRPWNREQRPSITDPRTPFLSPPKPAQHGINMMPFTPITEAYLDAAFVKEEYPVLANVLDRPGDPVEDEWKGFVHLDHAILDPVRF